MFQCGPIDIDGSDDSFFYDYFRKIKNFKLFVFIVRIGSCLFSAIVRNRPFPHNNMLWT